MRALVIANQKGGVGKSSTTINLGAGLARRGKKVLVIDSDPQGHTTLGLGISTTNKQTMAELLTQETISAADVIQKTYIPNLEIIPSDLSLAVADLKLAQMGAKEFKLRNKLGALEEKPDYLLIDSPPTFGNLTMNAFTTAQEVILPIQLGYFSLEGMNNFIDTLNFVNRDINAIINHKIEISGILITFFDMRAKLAREIYTTVSEVFGPKVYTTKIPQNIKINEAQSHGRAVCDYSPKCKGARAYAAFVEEILSKETEGERECQE